MGYYYCEICGNIVSCDDLKSQTLSCCGKKMARLDEYEDEMEFAEKHVPTYSIDGNTVCIKVGEMLHPSEDKHYIVFIELTTDKGKYTRILKPHDRPESCFFLGDDEKPKNVKIYCNVHGLWRRDFPDN